MWNKFYIQQQNIEYNSYEIRQAAMSDGCWFFLHLGEFRCLQDTHEKSFFSFNFFFNLEYVRWNQFRNHQSNHPP